MSIKCVLSSAQTYSRLFRPWDGKTQQDSTITSTTMQFQQVGATPENFKLSGSNTKSSGNNTKPNSITVRGEEMSLNSVQQTMLDLNQMVQFQQVPGYFPTPPLFTPPQLSTYQDLLIPNLPFMAVDPFVMEQEYARVLAEEAQVKMMTARKQRPKKFKCPHCNVAFSNNGQLKGHIRIHTGN